jgi:hypothetical protein
MRLNKRIECVSDEGSYLSSERKHAYFDVRNFMREKLDHVLVTSNTTKQLQYFADCMELGASESLKIVMPFQ